MSGEATSGTGGYFSATTGTALRAVGRVRLDKCVGVATIAAGASSVSVTPGIDVLSTGAVVATLRCSAGSATTTVSRCVVNPTTNKFTIHLTRAVAQNVKVAWHVFGRRDGVSGSSGAGSCPVATFGPCAREGPEATLGAIDSVR